MQDKRLFQSSIIVIEDIAGFYEIPYKVYLLLHEKATSRCNFSRLIPKSFFANNIVFPNRKLWNLYGKKIEKEFIFSKIITLLVFTVNEIINNDSL